MMKIKLILLLLGFSISLLSRKHHKMDCICGELLGIVFLVVISYMLNDLYGLVYVEPIRVAKLLLLGYLPGRVIDWMGRG